MLAPNLLTPDFVRAFQALMPRGRIWNQGGPYGAQAGTVTGLMGCYEAQTARSNNLLVDCFPATSYELLPEWEATLGLPDPCAGTPPSTQARRAQVVARLTNSGGQSAAYFIQQAAALGYTVTVTNYAPFRTGQSRCGMQLGNKDWFFTWSINAPLDSITYFATGQSTAGDPLATWGNDVLECEMNALKPAHTILQFHYLAGS
jgi:uncharacterized protein YmfQ (DUF2313 family)